MTKIFKPGGLRSIKDFNSAICTDLFESIRPEQMQADDVIEQNQCTC